jgi:hypothetical protein
VVALVNGARDQGQPWPNEEGSRHSPDGSRIAVMRFADDALDVVDMAADGSDPDVVANCDDAFCDHPNW